MKDKTLVLLAAGMGSRYGGLKQLDALGPHGETLMDYSVYDAVRAGFRKIVFVIRRDIEEEFKRVIGARYESVAEVKYAFQALEDLLLVLQRKGHGLPLRAVAQRRIVEKHPSSLLGLSISAGPWCCGSR